MRTLSSTLALGIALAAPAAAQVQTESSNLSFGLGGFMILGLGYVDTDDDLDNVGLVRDGELHFDGRLTADNGVTFGVDIEIELNGGENTDEASAFVEGLFGEIELGEQDGAGDAFQGTGVVAPPFSSAQDGDGFLFDYYDDFFTNGAPDSSGDETSDSLKVSYFTPVFSGFSAGVSYVPEPDDEGGNAVGRAGQTNAFELGAAYEGGFDDVEFRVGGGYTTDTEAAAEDDGSFGVGGAVGFGGFELGVNYGWSDDGGGDFSTIGFGATYGTGPGVFGADAAFVLDGASEDDIGVAAGVSYALAPGVAAGGVLEYGRDEARDADGFAVGVLTAIDF